MCPCAAGDAPVASFPLDGDCRYPPSHLHSFSACCTRVHMQATFDSMRQRLLSCSVGDFDLHSQTDLNPATPQGLANQMNAANLAGSIEVCLERPCYYAVGAVNTQGRWQSRPGYEACAESRVLTCDCLLRRWSWRILSAIAAPRVAAERRRRLLARPGERDQC